MLLEICVDSLPSSLAAKAGGADQLEVCGELSVGGITPSYFFVKELGEKVGLPRRCMVRPRSGDFCYSDSEFEEMRETIKTFGELGVEGVVFGILLPDGTLDVSRMEILAREAEDMKLTLHRAFDRAKDPFVALKQAEQIGFDTILTSGQASTAFKGKHVLAELVKHSSTIRILAGSGLTSEQIPALAEVGITSFHGSASKPVPSVMEYWNTALDSSDDFARNETQQETVQSMRNAIDQLLDQLPGQLPSQLPKEV